MSALIQVHSKVSAVFNVLLCLIVSKSADVDIDLVILAVQTHLVQHQCCIVQVACIQRHYVYTMAQ